MPYLPRNEPSYSWIKTPMHILRETCIEQVVQKWPPARFIEMGPGTGETTNLLIGKGFSGQCFDLSEQNRNILHQNLSHYQDKVEVLDRIDTLKPCSFDYLFAFEVLEHIPDDARALKEWSAYLKPGGKILMSVPAHVKKFGRDDEYAGHVRRYDKRDLQQLLSACGYAHIRILNYGFPLGNVTHRVNNFLHRFNTDYRSVPLQERTFRSGVDRPRVVYRLSRFLNSQMLFPFKIIQKWFYNVDWGPGYVAYAEKDAA
jgi:SAM-dependent methyltransferase